MFKRFLRTLGAAPTSVNTGVSAPNLGTVVTGSCNGSFSQGAAGATINIVTTGTYLISFSIAVNNVITSAIGDITGTNVPATNQTSFPATHLGQATFYIVGSAIIKQASGVYNVNISTNPAPSTLNGAGNTYGFITAVRLG